jgi:hypothetical protein
MSVYAFIIVESTNNMTKSSLALAKTGAEVILAGRIGEHMTPEELDTVACIARRFRQRLSQ